MLSCSTRALVVIAPFSADFKVDYGNIAAFYHPAPCQRDVQHRYRRPFSARRPIFGQAHRGAAPVLEAGLLRERVRVECGLDAGARDGPAAKPLAALPREARSWLETLARDPGEPTPRPSSGSKRGPITT